MLGSIPASAALRERACGSPVISPDIPAVLTVSLGAVAENWRILSAKVGAACRVAAVVKADAYGLGLVPVAQALAQAGCRWFFVATAAEGALLSASVAETGLRIVVLNGVAPGGARDLLAHGLVPAINRLDELAEWRQAAPQAAAVLNLDSGMSRLGLTAADLARLAGRPALLRGVAPMLVMSHLACADDPEHALNAAQRARFLDDAALLPKAPLSLAASSGVFLGDDYHLDIVRCGAALWGLNPTPARPNPMRPVLRLQARILQIMDLPAGRSVGYGASATVARPTRVATVAAGYADGILRAATSRATAFIGGFAAPYLGRVSMDLITLDVSGVPERCLAVGCFVDLIGPDYDADALARDCGTIGYEVLTRLSPRLHRVYLP